MSLGQLYTSGLISCCLPRDSLEGHLLNHQLPGQTPRERRMEHREKRRPP